MPSVDDTVVSKEVAPGVNVLLHTYWESWLQEDGRPGYVSIEVSVEQWDVARRERDIPFELMEPEFVPTERGVKVYIGGPGFVGTKEIFFDDTNGGVPEAWREGYFTGRDVVKMYGEEFNKAVEAVQKQVDVPPGFHSPLGGSFGEGMSDEEFGLRGQRAVGAVAAKLGKRAHKVGKPGWYGEPGRHSKAAKKGHANRKRK